MSSLEKNILVLEKLLEKDNLNTDITRRAELQEEIKKILYNLEYAIEGYII